jgi:flagellar motor switch protein FliG
MYTDMLAESMGWDPSQSAEGPFDFLHKLTQKELVRLFDQEDPNNIAFIAAYWEAEEMMQVLAILPDSARKQAVLQIARLQGLPKEVVHQAAVRFAQRLKAIRSRNEVDVDGSEVVARVLGTVDSGTEEELLKFIEREDPATRDRLRAHYFSFDSMHLVPAEVLTAVFETADPSMVTKALVGADDGLVSAVLSVLPSKQRSIVEDDVRLANSQNNVPKHETAEARKILTAEARKAMKDRGIDLASLSGGGHAAAASGGYGSSAPTAYSGAPTTMMDSPVSIAEADTQGGSADAGIINLDSPPDSGDQAA